MLKDRKLKNRPMFPHWRHEKKYVIKTQKEIERTGYFFDCNSSPCVVTEIGKYRTNRAGIYCCDVYGTSLLTGNPSGCSMIHCRPEPLTKKDALERKEFHEIHGEIAYLQKYIFPGKSIDEVKKIHEEYAKEWLTDIK